MPNPNAPAAPAAKEPAAPATNPPTAPTTLAIDERFATLAAQFMAQANAQIEALRVGVSAQLSASVDPLHKDLHDLLDAQMQVGARVDKLEALQPVPAARLHELEKLIEGFPEVIAQEVALKIQPNIQPVITVTSQSIEDRVKKLESRLRFF